MAATNTTPEPEDVVAEIISTTTVLLKEGGVKYHGVASEPLDRMAFFNRLSKEDKERVIAREVELDDLRPKREVTEIEESDEDLAAMTAFLRLWGPKVKSVDAARRALTAKKLLKGEDAAHLQALADVNWGVLTSWVSYKNAKGKFVALDKAVSDGIAAAKKASESDT